MHDRPHLPMSPAEAASLRASSPVDEALLQRIRAALVNKDADDGMDSTPPAPDENAPHGSAGDATEEPVRDAAGDAAAEPAEAAVREARRAAGEGAAPE